MGNKTECTGFLARATIKPETKAGLDKTESRPPFLLPTPRSHGSQSGGGRVGSRSKCSSPVPPNAPISRQRSCECAVMLRMLRHRIDRPSSHFFSVHSLYISDTQGRTRWEGSSPSLCLADHSDGILHSRPRLTATRGCSCRYGGKGLWARRRLVCQRSTAEKPDTIELTRHTITPEDQQSSPVAFFPDASSDSGSLSQIFQKTKEIARAAGMDDNKKLEKIVDAVKFLSDVEDLAEEARIPYLHEFKAKIENKETWFEIDKEMKRWGAVASETQKRTENRIKRI
ncbi:hypothetical protein GOBAR_AA20432 [Gossypium barbadense]|uniref:Uncharacterized protein n=1 Tax=Gossypium barbadense TaxID=3634 RepID=A0A2P5XA64_GOSBA|nr:hypothetical protein GOBAR_AA20432 [Gossypium barbadense]